MSKFKAQNKSKIQISKLKFCHLKFVLCYYFVICALSFLLGGCATEYNIYTGKEQIIFYSDEKELRLGKSLARQVEKRFESLDDYFIQEWIEGIGRKIASVCDRRELIYYFKVLDEKENNAFALPGGYVYVFKGLLENIENDDELAYVLAHEISHIVARHSIYRLQKGLGYSILLAIAGRGAPNPQTRIKANAAIELLMRSYSREDELMADRLAVRFLKRAGFNPKGALTFLERFRKIKQKEPIRRFRYSTHPYLMEKIRVVKEEIYGMIGFEEYINQPVEGP